MKFIEFIDTAYFEKKDYNNLFIIAVSEEEYELLKTELIILLNNSEDYDNMFEEMKKCIEKHGAELICPDFILKW